LYFSEKYKNQDMRVSIVQISPSGPYFSRLILGLWRIAEASENKPTDVLRLIEESIALGITTFDHADIYGNYTCEELFGNALKLAPAIRQQVQLITKCGIKLISGNRPSHKIKSYDTTKRHIIASVENSLTKLHTDFIDLLLIHRPSPLMDPNEVAEAFEVLKKEGKVLYFGVSNFSPGQYDLLQSYVKYPLVTNQIEISPLNLDPFTNGQLDHCLKNRFSPMAWSPFGGGRVFKHEKEGDKRVFLKLDEIAKRHQNATIDQVVIAWLFKHPAKILPVLGTGKAERIKALVHSEKIHLSNEEWFEIWSAATGQEVP
jgi:predicted oxidoreductase